MKQIDLDAFRKEATGKAAENKRFLTRLKKTDSRDLDRQFHDAHDEAFEEIDCLSCANCCKTTSPIFYQADIERVARVLNMKPGMFVEKYLCVDEDNDHVLKSSPCPFLDSDNHCKVYDSRPKACREYPHTDRKKMVQVLDLAYKNTMVCPAVLRIVEKLKSL
jgi:uncharacterized protein